jgi:polysaccharide export outer membrane protein
MFCGHLHSLVSRSTLLAFGLGFVVHTFISAFGGGAAYAQAIPASNATQASQVSDPGASGDSREALSTYRLAAGDVVSVKVFNEPDFTQERIRLTDAGTLSFPILGELAVLGMTTGELEGMITQRLKGRILVNPQVTVWIEQYRPFFINGMVERPGAYPYLPGLTVRKAASIAGGLRERASTSKIFVLREKARMSDKGVRATLDTEIGPGDTITVEESFF